MSFCRITGRCKALPKPNYFPLLPPISPSDAKRFCKITGKSYGLPSHHYIPVIVSGFKRNSKCKITNISDDLGPHHYGADSKYGKRNHVVLAGYKYMLPTIDTSNVEHQRLIDILDAKTPTENGHFVYKVEERKFHLVFPAKLEAALRDGDVRDLMLGKDSDTIRMKMKRGKSVIIGLQSISENSNELLSELYEGEGPTDDVLREIQKEQAKQNKKKKNLSQMMKIFENKQELMDIEKSTMLVREHNDEMIASSMSMRHSNENEINKTVTHKQQTVADEFRSRLEKMTRLNEILLSGDSCDLMNPFIESWNWETYREEARKIDTFELLSTKLPKSIKVEPIVTHNKEAIIDEKILKNTIGFEVIPWVGELLPHVEKPEATLIEKIINRQFDEISIDKIIEKLDIEDYCELFPTMENVSSVINGIDCNGKLYQVSDRIGVLIKSKTIDEKDIFVPGKLISEKFVPGQMVDDAFIPGLCVKSENGVSFIPGFILESSDNNKENKYIAGVIEGGAFIAGQTISNTATGSESFIEGQTVVTFDSIKFIPGIVDENSQKFLPGQFISSEFVPGQMIQQKFIPGQNYQSAETNEWTFIPGQTVDGEFIPGKTIITDDGSKFIPGQIIDETFVPGITRVIDNVAHFIPGINIETKNGTQFVEGQILKTENGEVFHPGKTVLSKSNDNSTTKISHFEISKSVEEIIFHEPVRVSKIINPNTLEMNETSLSVFGNMVQTHDKIEFYPSKVKIENIPQGNIIPGKLIKQGGQSKFVPGIITEDGFSPGQVVWTETGEQFIPGQVIETSDGLKFVPGQVIETKTGNKFVPGQTIETADGPRFVPGQIIYTKSGPTFIPGQIMHTDDDVQRFVPGQVVDTEYGPQFVPGSVIETDDSVTFVPGQIVETSEGLKFIAPDLTSNDEGEDEFSLQSFLVSSEELQLLKAVSYNVSNTGNYDFSFDSNMMEQLSAAGISIGQQVQTSMVDYVLQSTKDKQTVQTFIHDHFAEFPIDVDAVENVFNEIKVIVESLTTCDQVKITSKNRILDPSTRRAVDILTATVMAVKKSFDDDENLKIHPNRKTAALYDTIGRGLVQSLDKSEEMVILLNAIKSFRKQDMIQKVKQNIIQIEGLASFETSKSDIVRNLAQQQCQDELELFHNICDILENDEELISAFQVVAQDCPKIVFKVIKKLRDINNADITDDNAVEAIKRSIAKAIKESIEKEVRAILESSSISISSLSSSSSSSSSSSTISSESSVKMSTYCRSILEQTIGFSRALRLPENITSTIINVLMNEKQNINNLCDDDEILELICRVHLMNKLAENDSDLKGCLRELQQNNNSSLSSSPSFVSTYYSENNYNNNIKLSKLVRKSGLLIIESQNELKSSPSGSKLTSILMTGNLLQIEDYLVRCGTKSKGAFLILKNGLQMVVPRELSHDIITGKCPFTVLDDNGIRHFEPAHMFSLLRTKNQHLLSHRFSMYTCDISDTSRL